MFHLLATDPTGGSYASGVNEVLNFVHDVVAPSLFVFCATVVTIIVGLRWLRKAMAGAAGGGWESSGDNSHWEAEPSTAGEYYDEPTGAYWDGERWFDD